MPKKVSEKMYESESSSSDEEETPKQSMRKIVKHLKQAHVLIKKHHKKGVKQKQYKKI